MVWRFAFAVACLSFVLSPGAVTAEPGSAPAAEDYGELLVEAHAWVAAHTNYPPPPLPSACEATQDELKKRCFPDAGSEVLPNIDAAYDRKTATIYLDSPFDPASPKDRSMLVHEMVHHFQLQNDADRTAPCRDVLEGEALRLQVAWLEDHGVTDPLGLLNIDAFTLQVLRTCPM